MGRPMDEDVRQFAKQVIDTEAAAVRSMAAAVEDPDFARAVRLIADCPSSVLTTGIGKAGHIARKVSATLASTGTPSHLLSPPDVARAVRRIADCPSSGLATGIGKAGHIARKVSATLASTGTPSHFLSPTDAVHGDLGSVRKGDVILIFSASGESDEILRLLSIVKKLDHPVVAITATKTSGLGKFADCVLPIGRIEEACPLGLAPSASTTAMLALGDALALSVMK